MAGKHERNTTGLISSREKRAKGCQERLEQAIGQLLKEHGKITFNSVAERARLSKSYLYTHLEVRERIETLRKQQEGLSSRQVKREMTDASKDVLLAAKNKRIKELEEEVKRLQGILEHRYGEEYGKGF